MVEYIRGEGPPNFSSKDAIEKNHGVIKDQIFLQNQKARSRNTCLKSKAVNLSTYFGRRKI